MGVLVNGALAAAAGVAGSLVASLTVSKVLVFPIALACALVAFFMAGSVFPEPSRTAGRRGVAASTELEEAASAKAAKKARKLAAERAKKEAAEAAKAEEAAAKAAAKKAAAKQVKKGKKAAPVVESEEEPEPEVESEEEVVEAPKSKTAIKKAKAKAKEAAAKAEAEAAAKAAAAAEKKNKKKGAVAPAAAEPAAAAPAKKATAAEKAAAKAAAAAAAADTEGWETIEAPKPTKSQAAKQAAGAVSSPPATKKSGSIPASERELTEDIMIPVDKHFVLVGAGGATRQKLEEGSGAKIDMPKRVPVRGADGKERMVSQSPKIQITGTPAAVATAKNAIMSLVERGYSHITNPGTLSDDITVGPHDLGLIMGAQGQTLKRIQMVTGAKIELPEREHKNAKPDGKPKKVLIVGEKEAVRAAKAALKALLADGFSEHEHPDWIKEEVAFPAEKFGILIGPKGSTIKHIQNSSKARVNLPDKSSKSSIVVVAGPPAAVAMAVKDINRLLEPPPQAETTEEDLATDDAWGQEHTAQGEDALW